MFTSTFLKMRRTRSESVSYTTNMMAQEPMVLSNILSQDLYSSERVTQEVSYFYGDLKLHMKYFARYGVEDIAKHISTLISAKHVAMLGQTPMCFNVTTGDNAIFLCSNSNSLDSLEPTLNKLTKHIDTAGSYSLIYLNSEGPLYECGLNSDTLAMFFVDKCVLEAPEDPNEKSLFQLASASFLKNKSPPCLEVYQQVIDFVVDKQVNYIGWTTEAAFSADPNLVTQCMDVFQFASPSVSCRSFLSFIFDVLDAEKCPCSRIYEETFANGIHTYFVHFDRTVDEHSKKLISESLHYGCHFKATPGRSKRVWDLVKTRAIRPAMCPYMLALVKFAYHFFPKTIGTVREMGSNYRLFSEEAYYEIVVTNPYICNLMFDHFRKICETGSEKPTWCGSTQDEIEKLADPHSRKVLLFMLRFNQAIRITNFFKPEVCSALAYRFDPVVVLRGHELPEMPFGLYLILGREFIGFHIRFREISRGGIRMIMSGSKTAYDLNCSSLFEENVNLAYTQQMKNKDIPEGGSKGTILVNSFVPDSRSSQSVFYRYIDALVDCMIPLQCGIFAGHLQSQELLFFGPDENTADFMDLGAERAKTRGYPFWKSLTTGKSTALGGVPHDVYGMTTAGVHEYVIQLLNSLNLDETQLTKFQTGGPDGDLGSNEILVSKDKTIGIVDGSGVGYAKDGLNRPELVRLAKARLPIAHYNRELLGPEDFVIPIEQLDITLPDGSTWRSGVELRNLFHLTNFATADLFVPCGGRPNCVEAKNVHKLFNDNGVPKFKYIVEGANLYFTDEARLELENRGVILFKDASTNKGGVTSSSLEVLASLALSAEQHQELLCINDGEVPETYSAYVEEILARIRGNAKMEFQALMNAKESTNTEFTRRISGKINKLADGIRSKINLEQLPTTLMTQVFPKTLVEVCGIDSILRNVPQAYQSALVASYIASTFVYQHGIEESEFQFYEFFNGLLSGELTI